jgi:hypothetical protein
MESPHRYPYPLLSQFNNLELRETFIRESWVQSGGSCSFENKILRLDRESLRRYPHPLLLRFDNLDSGASRNIYLGNLKEEVTGFELYEDLGKFGPIDILKVVREKTIGFVHFLSIGNTIKAVCQLS